MPSSSVESGAISARRGEQSGTIIEARLRKAGFAPRSKNLVIRGITIAGEGRPALDPRLRSLP